jgi:hypothetical protein
MFQGGVMKVVINRCYGGFALSDEAVERCLELGMKLTSYNDKGYADRDAHFVRISQTNKYYAIGAYESNFRADPRVVQVVEELGVKANGSCTELKVIEIPFDGTAGWLIDEYDGMESVVPVHERWS